MPKAKDPVTDATLPRVLRSARTRRRMTQAAICRRLTEFGLPTVQGTYSAYELGELDVSDERIEALERILELDGELWEAKRQDARDAVNELVGSALASVGANLSDRDEHFPGYLSPSDYPQGITYLRPVLAAASSFPRSLSVTNAGGAHAAAA
jgi:transcriptional regulator with XRE-family HTH domain